MEQKYISFVTSFWITLTIRLTMKVKTVATDLATMMSGNRVADNHLKGVIPLPAAPKRMFFATNTKQERVTN